MKKYLLLHSFSVPQKQFPRNLIHTFPSRIWSCKIELVDEARRSRSRTDKGCPTWATRK